ncbi:MAG: endolytic transglycosylase MltG [Clostridiales bacterium]|nr:endolytic transglycosylase MltG [Clostridiales bacterium]
MTQQKKKKKGMGCLIFLIVVVLLILGVFLGIMGYINKHSQPMDPGNTAEINVTIPMGSSTRGVASALYHAELIDNALVFRIQSKLNEFDGKFQAGNYVFSADMSMLEIMEALIEGVSYETTRFTIPEGYTLAQTLEALAEAGLDTLENFKHEAEHGKFDYWFLEDAPEGENRLEGYLYPETYEVYVDAGAHGVLDKMLSQFDKMFTREMANAAKNKGYDINEIVTIASLIEREASVDKDRPLVASVIYNRLEKGMKLQIDATVLYALGVTKPVVTLKDLEVDSPYNTYKNKGFPPGPICSPGKASLEAALEPADTGYYYYVLGTDGTGAHVFSKTYAEHEKHADAYRKWRDNH